MERGSGSSKQVLIVMARTGSALASRWTKVGDGTSCAAASSASWTGSRLRTRTVDEEDRRVYEPDARWRDAGAWTAGRGRSRRVRARRVGDPIRRLGHGGDRRRVDDRHRRYPARTADL